ncbi:MAG: hypothetical protein ACJ72N_01700 [Labedaea sp.]
MVPIVAVIVDPSVPAGVLHAELRSPDPGTIWPKWRARLPAAEGQVVRGHLALNIFCTL